MIVASSGQQPEAVASRSRGALGTAAWFALVGAGLVACNAVLGIDDIEFGEPSGTGGAGAAATGGHGGSGGAQGGGGGGTFCTPNTTTACYTGPPGTEDVGSCHGGTATCLPDGSAYGACVGDVLPSAEDCATDVVDENCDGQMACTGDAVWSQRFGSAANEHGQGIAVDGAANVLLTGDYEGVLDFGGGALPASGQDIYAAKLTTDGDHVWSARFGDDQVQWSDEIACDAAGNFTFTEAFSGSVDFGGGALTGDDAYDAYFARFDPAGAHLASKSFSGNGEQHAFGLAVAPTGELFLGGSFQNNVSFGGPTLVSSGAADAFVAKLAPDGGHLWSIGFGSNNDQVARDLALDPDGNVLVAGYYQNNLSLPGCANPPSGNATDGFVAKLAPDGTCLWVKGVNGANVQSVWAVASDGAGNVYFAGRFQGSVTIAGVVLNASGFVDYDAFVAKLGPDGSNGWAVSAGDLGLDMVQDMAVDARGEVVVIGQFSGSFDFGGSPLQAQGGADVFVTKLSPAGDVVWSRGLGDAADQGEPNSEGVAIDALGFVYVTMSFDGTVDFGNGPLTTAGGGDIAVAKLRP